MASRHSLLHRAARRLLQLEPLERRELLSAAPPFSLSDYDSYFNGGRQLAVLLSDDFTGNNTTLRLETPGDTEGNKKPEVDLEGHGWQADNTKELWTVNGQLVGRESNPQRSNYIDLAPIPNDSLVQITTDFGFQGASPPDTTQAVAFGFDNADGERLTTSTTSGPWVQFIRSGTIEIYCGANKIGTATTTFADDTTYSATFTYDCETEQVQVQLGSSVILFNTKDWTKTGLDPIADTTSLRDRLTVELNAGRDDNVDKVAWMDNLVVKELSRPAPTILQDGFNGSAGSVATNSRLDLELTNLERATWKGAGGQIAQLSGPDLAGNGFLLGRDGLLDSNKQSVPAYTSIDLTDLGTNSVVRASTSLSFTQAGQWVGLGFEYGTHALNTGVTGPWLKISENGKVEARIGTAVTQASYTFPAGSNPFAAGSSTVPIELYYDVDAQRMGAVINGVEVPFIGADDGTGHLVDVTNNWVLAYDEDGNGEESKRDGFGISLYDPAVGNGVPQVDSIKIEAFSRRPPLDRFASDAAYLASATVLNFAYDPLRTAAQTTMDLSNLVYSLDSNNTYTDSTTPVIIQFAPGDYHFTYVAGNGTKNHAYSDTTHVLNFKNRSDLWLKGGPGVNIWIDDMRYGFVTFSVNNQAASDSGLSRNVKVSDLHIDYKTVPWGQGVVYDTGSDSGGRYIDVDFTVSSGDANGNGKLVLPIDDTSYASGAEAKWGYVLAPDPATGGTTPIPGQLRANTGQYIVASMSQPDVTHYPNRIKIYLKGNYNNTETLDSFNQLKSGDFWVQHYRYNGSSLITSPYSNDVTLQNIAVSASPQIVFGGEESQALNVLNCWMEIKPGRWKATDGDNVHVRSPLIGPWVEGCTLTGSGDDVTNFYAIGYGVEKINDSTHLELVKLASPFEYPDPNYSALDFRDFSVGDPITFINPETGAVICSKTIAAVNTATRTITLNEPLTAGEQGAIDQSYITTDWHQLSVTINGSTIAIYVDGVQHSVVSENINSFTSVAGHAGTTTSLGGAGSDGSVFGTGEDFIGELDDVAIYDGVTFDAATILGLFDGNKKPIYQWNLDGSGANTIANAPALTVTGPTYNTDRTRGAQSLYFASAAQTATFTSGTLTAASTRSVAMWVKPTQQLDQVLYEEGDATNGFGIMRTSGAAVRVRVRVNGTIYDYVTADAKLTKDVWKHLGVTFDNGTVKVFINGVDVGLTSSPATPPATIPARGTACAIGSVNVSSVFDGLTTSSIRGYLDDVRVFSAALTNDDYEVYASTNMIAKWEMDAIGGGATVNLSTVTDAQSLSIAGATINVSDQKQGLGCLNFANATDGATTTQASINNAFTSRTYTMWFKPSTPLSETSGSQILYEEGDATNGFGIRLIQDRIEVYAKTWNATTGKNTELHAITAPGTKDTVLYNYGLGNSYMFRGNDVTNSFRYGVNAKATNGMILNNYFAGLAGPAVGIRSEPDWPEGVVPKNVIVMSNTIANDAFMHQYLWGDERFVGAIEVHHAREIASSGYTDDEIIPRSSGTDAIAYGPEDIKILGNIITDWWMRAITVFNADNVDILGNRIYDPHAAIVTNTPPYGGDKQMVDVYNANVRNMTGSGTGATISGNYWKDAASTSNLVYGGRKDITGYYDSIYSYGFGTNDGVFGQGSGGMSALMMTGGSLSSSSASAAALSDGTLNALYDQMFEQPTQKSLSAAVDAALEDWN